MQQAAKQSAALVVCKGYARHMLLLMTGHATRLLYVQQAVLHAALLGW